jgi:hypothetical protein
VRSEPVRDERQLALGALRVLVLLAVPAGAVSWLVAGPAGAVSALIGLGFVVVLFVGSAALLAWSARRGAETSLGLLAGGVVGRLLLYMLTLNLLSQFAWVHRPSLALSTMVAIVVSLAYELRLLARSPRLFWLDTAARSSTSVAGAPSTATRSPSL